MKEYIRKTLFLEKKLLSQLNSKKTPSNIDEEFNKLFKREIYNETCKFTSNIRLHDSRIINLTERKININYESHITFDFLTIFDEKNEIGYYKKPTLIIHSKEKVRLINNKVILNFLIDEKSKTLGILFMSEKSVNVIVINYENIVFNLNQPIYY